MGSKNFRVWAAAGAVLMMAMTPSASLFADALDDNYTCYEQFKGGDDKLAVFYCSRAIEAGTLPQAELVTALLNRGVAHKNLGNLDLAIIDYGSAIDLAPEDALPWANRANARLEKGELEEALKDISQSISLNPDRATSYYVRGAIQEARGDTGAAHLDFLKAYELQPSNQAFKQKAGK